jgi:hypothetical protein
MTWEDFALARQLELEVEVGTRIREAKHVEDRIAAKTRKNARGPR